MITEETVLVFGESTLKYLGEKRHGFCSLLSMAQNKYTHTDTGHKHSKIFITVVNIYIYNWINHKMSVHLGCYNKNSAGCGSGIVYELWRLEAKIKVVFWRELPSWFRGTIFSLCPQVEGARSALEPLGYEALIPFMRVPLLWLKHLSKAPSTNNTLLWG